VKIYGRPLGWNAVADAVDAERRGFDGVRVIDHFAMPHTNGAVRATPHGLVGLSAAAGATTTIALTQTMMCVSFRHPGEVAQAIATLHRVSGGRAELGLGAGWHKGEHDAFGYDFPAPGQRLRKLREAAEICRAMLHHDGAVSYQGQHYTAEFPGGWPEYPTVPDILIGGSGPRLLELAGGVADRVDLLHTIREGRPLLDAEHLNDADRVAAMRDTVLRAGDGSGNKPAISATIFTSLSTDPAEVARRREALATASGASLPALADELLYVVGTPEDLVRSVTRLGELGVDRVHIGTVPPGPDETFAVVAELLPVLRGVPTG
jgi:alkanesulfonate monooxygenase SsuD/methylene tetrahydromethanopterin reductase-like flavin-dependent oxidoreductase (luciferase family)